MKKRIWIVLIIFVLLVIGGFLTYKYLNINKGKEKVVLSTECDYLEEGQEKYRCYDYLAEKKRNLLICDKIEKDNYKWGCYYNMALVKADKSICDIIKSESQKSICFNDIEQKWSRYDLSICDGLGSNSKVQSNCMKLVAIFKEDSSICKDIKLIEYKDLCYLHIAGNTGDLSICNNIQDVELKKLCLES